ncbi:MAG TPA: O-antigen ligase family protein [Candidatus Dormibacteraeota bacterium]|nr:O-antigen ligase family protein [Candidatus Dormibacteraeota bacterium]
MRTETNPERGLTALGQFPISFGLAGATCALAPAYVIRWHIGPLPSTLLEAAILLTIAAFAVEAYRAKHALEWRSPFTIPAAVFLVAGAISVLVSPEHVKGLGLYRAYLVEPIAFYFVLGHVTQNAWRARVILGGLAAGASVAGIANAVVILNAIRHHTLNLALPPPVVIYNTPNAVALYLVPLIGIAASLFLYDRDRWVRPLSALFLAISLGATFLSLSRGGYFALAVIALILAVVNRYRWYLLPAVVVLGVAMSRVPAIATRMAHEFNLSDPNNTFVSRLNLWEATLRMLKDRPIFGSGLFGFARSIQPYRGGVYEENLIYPHNFVLNMWTETGLLGLAAFLWLLVQTFRVSWKGWTSGPQSWRAIQLGIVLAMVAIVIHGLVDVPYFKNDLALEFWTFLGLAWAGTRAAKAEVG